MGNAGCRVTGVHRARVGVVELGGGPAQTNASRAADLIAVATICVSARSSVREWGVSWLFGATGVQRARIAVGGECLRQQR